MQSPEPLQDDDEEHETVSRLENGDVSVFMPGWPTPAILPKETAIQFAALVLKKAGCVVKLNHDSLIARFKPITAQRAN